MENVAFWFWAPYLPSPKRTESCSLVSPFEIGWLIYSCFSPSCMRRNRGCEISPCFLLPISFEPIAPVFPPLLSLSLSLPSPSVSKSSQFTSVFESRPGCFFLEWRDFYFSMTPAALRFHGVGNENELCLFSKCCSLLSTTLSNKPHFHHVKDNNPSSVSRCSFGRLLTCHRALPLVTFISVR